jgi:hypothetical protein
VFSTEHTKIFYLMILTKYTDIYFCVLGYIVHKLVSGYQFFWRNVFPCILWYIALNIIDTKPEDGSSMFSNLLVLTYRMILCHNQKTNLWMFRVGSFIKCSEVCSLWFVGNLQGLIARIVSSLILFCLSRYFLCTFCESVIHSLHHSS